MKLNTINNVKLIKFNSIKSRNAILNIFEKIDKLFVIKRIFTVQVENIKNNKRGEHAHKIDKQIITCPYGEIEFKVDDGKKTRLFKINTPNEAIFVPTDIWTETTYKKVNTVVTCYCSEKYTEKSYIRKYNEFLDYRSFKNY
jgi:hypothetical protein